MFSMDWADWLLTFTEHWHSPHCWACEPYGVACRFADSGDAVARHVANARQRSASLLLCLLHLRNHRSPAVVWPAAQSLLSWSARQHLSRQPVSLSVAFYQLDALEDDALVGNCSSDRSKHISTVALCGMSNEIGQVVSAVKFWEVYSLIFT